MTQELEKILEELDEWIERLRKYPEMEDICFGLRMGREIVFKSQSHISRERSKK